jgi:DNA repair photolyase
MQPALPSSNQFTRNPLLNPPQKGRGALANPAGRLEQTVRFVSRAYLEEQRLEQQQCLEASEAAGGYTKPAQLATQVQREIARSLISKNQSPDIPFELSVNPYRGCEHGCFYCYARPNHTYVNLSPGLDFETQLFAKVNTVELLQKELARPGYQVSPINLGSVTDCYQPIEREYQLTRGVLQVLDQANHPVTIVTKNALIERDIDILSSMAQRNLVQVFISVTSLDPVLSQKMEPRASAPWRRLKTVAALAQAGVPVSVLIAPIIPFINEPEIEAIAQEAAKAGARSIHYTVLRMPFELKELTRDWLYAHFPDRAERVLRRVQDMRGGQDYDSRFGVRMRGQGVWAQLIKTRFHGAVRRNKLANQRLQLNCHDFKPPSTALAVPARQAEPSSQLPLFA